MRTALRCSGLILLLTGATTTHAQTSPADRPAPVEMTITAREVEARSGCAPGLYATSKLRQGDKVVVLEKVTKTPGWLAIKPPTGSFSWINKQVIQRRGPYEGIVLAGEETVPSVPVLAGSSQTNQRPNVEAAKVARGTLVVIIGEEQVADDGVWLPIQPTPKEVRYIPSDAVSGSTPMQLAAANGAVPGQPQAALVAGSAVRGLLTQADQAYQAGDYGRAKQMYTDAANQTNDYSEKIYCYNRLNMLAGGGNLSAQYAAPGHPSNSTPAPGQPGGQTTSLYGTNPGAAPGAPQWSQWGKLRRTEVRKDGRSMYVLESNQGQPLLYATTSPSLSLEPYVGRLVCMYGQISFGNDYLRMHYMTVSHVALP